MTVLSHRKMDNPFHVLSICAAVMLILFVLTESAQADSMRCGSRIVTTGDSKAEVLMECGEPSFREVVGEKTVYRRFFYLFGESYTVLVEKWTYNLGSTQFLRILTFEGDTLVDVELGDKP